MFDTIISVAQHDVVGNSASTWLWPWAVYAVLLVAFGYAFAQKNLRWLRVLGGVGLLLLAGHVLYHEVPWKLLSNRIVDANRPLNRVRLGCLLSAVGIWLMLPQWRSAVVQRMGVPAAFAGIAMLMSLLPSMGDVGVTVLWWVLASLTIVSAVATVTSRSPVYCAIWFAVTLLGTGGLFMVNGAQFLGVATVAVYAGAIVVTFLFVLMLSQPEGHAYYDRISWGAVPSLLACLAGASLVGVVLWSTLHLQIESPTTDRAAGVLADTHVATLGGLLFSRYIIGVEVAATLLLAALVGAVAITMVGNAQRSRGGSLIDRVLSQPGGEVRR
ncbi:MAG: NADH-quinone oxidoreductase subunit J [Pirellulaceae bacterium]|nr:NADH-quinone oxidoreductase subunit J [Planctomycetales bacterium]